MRIVLSFSLFQCYLSRFYIRAQLGWWIIINCKASCFQNLGIIQIIQIGRERTLSLNIQNNFQLKPRRSTPHEDFYNKLEIRCLRPHFLKDLEQRKVKEGLKSSRDKRKLELNSRLENLPSLEKQQNHGLWLTGVWIPSLWVSFFNLQKENNLTKFK